VADRPGVVAFIGASRMGKSEGAKELLRGRRGLVLVWSPLEPTDRYAQYLGAVVVRTLGAVIAAIRAGCKRVVLWPMPGTAKEWQARFELFCTVARSCKGAAVMVDELSLVTTASHAPHAWRNLCCSGMHDGILVVGSAQRPAQIDKDFLDNCTEVRCYRLGTLRSAVAVAEVIHCEPRDLLVLPKYHYLHRDKDALRTVAGVQKKISLKSRKGNG
jgi:hypothetical protein